MSSIETIAYTSALMTLAASCAVFILSSRNTQYAPRLAALLAAVAFLALSIGLSLRGIFARRWPLGSPFEFTLAFAASIVLIYLFLSKAAETPWTGATAVLLALLLMSHALLVQAEAARIVQPFPPVMRGVWFALHTLLTAIAYGALTVAGAVGVSGLAVPSLPVIAFVDQAMAVGYIALSLGMIAGGIWGERAWGAYWSWSTKEAWTLVTWLVCTFHYHVRQRRGWRGRRAMGIAALAMVAVLVTFFLTPTLLRWTRLQRWRIY